MVASLTPQSIARPLPADGLEHIFVRTQKMFEDLQGARIFVTGGTGFFGRWLVESFLYMKKALSLDATITVLTRDRHAFALRAPHIALDEAVTFIEGDIRSFEMPVSKFSHIIHAATDASVTLDTEDPALMYETIVKGTRHLLSFIEKQNDPRCLLVSSGAVYGKQPSSVTHMPEAEEAVARPLSDYSAYAQGKRDAEKVWMKTGPIARCFAFVGPCLPLDAHFAIGNFMRDAMMGKTIDVRGDGTPERSYLYAADLAVWLWTLLLRGENGRTYNVGSEKNMSIAEIAGAVAQSVDPPVPVHVSLKPQSDKPIERYVPSTKRAREELGLVQETDLREAIQKTVRWYTG